MDCSDCPLVEVVPGKVSGVPILKHSRVQADSIVENYGCHPVFQDRVRLDHATMVQ